MICGQVHEHADAPDPVGFLRARGERPVDRGGREKRNNIPSSQFAAPRVFHSEPPWNFTTICIPRRTSTRIAAYLVTQVAWARSFGGHVTPSFAAIKRLIQSSKLVFGTMGGRGLFGLLRIPPAQVPAFRYKSN